RLPDAERDAVLGAAWLTVSASDGGDWAPSLIEANGAGVPALARRVSGMTDAVRHGRTGWLVDGTSAELGAAVSRALTVLADPVVAATMAGRARSWAARFTWTGTAAGLLTAVGLEDARLERRRHGFAERRAGNDLVVVLSVPESAIRGEWQTSRRAGDVWVSDGTVVRGLLAGADEGDVQGILDRLDVDRTDPAVSVLVARHADLLGQWSDPEDAIDLAEAVGRPVEVRSDDQGGDRHAA
ncbi:glycosyltransferase, partial [Modestobacter versicolor]